MHPKPFDSAELFIGSELEGRYRIEAKLGAGGVGAVYRATHLKLQRAVAIKVLQEQYGASRELRQRFEREARALAALSHPHIVTVTDYGIFNGMPFLVMELLEGETLGQRLASGPLDPVEAIDVAGQLLRALAFVHERGLVHRDLKPGNIFLQSVPGSRPHVKLLDFGLAKFIAPEVGQNTLTRAGQIFGTPSYMAPEQVTGEATDPSTDVYAMGILLYEILTGHTPFDGDASQVMRKHLVEELPDLDKHCPDRKATPTLRALMRRATAKSKGHRYPNAIELAHALNALEPPFVDGPGGARRDEVGSAAAKSKEQPPPSLRHLAWHAALPAVAIAALFALLIFLRKEGEEQAADRAAPSAERSSTAAPTDTAPITAPFSQAEPTGAPTPAAASALDEPHRTADQQTDSDPAPPLPAPKISAQQLWSKSPKLLVASRDAVNNGTPLSRKTMTYIHKYNADNKGDPRGHLILARSHLERGWRRDAVNEYAIAFKLNPDSRVHPGMLEDLVELASGGSHAAGELIRSAYGPSAAGAIDRALTETTVDRIAADRLRKLKNELGI